MEKDVLKDLIYGGVLELMNNRKYFYRGISASYSHWTEEGEKAIADYMHLMGNKMLESEEISFRNRSKELVMKTLKGENS